MPVKGSAQESFGRSQIAPLAELKFNRVAVAVDRPVEIHPTPTDFDVGFVDMPSPADGPLV